MLIMYTELRKTLAIEETFKSLNNISYTYKTLGTLKMSKSDGLDGV